MLPKKDMVMEVGSKENFRCTLRNETLIRWYNSTGQELSAAPGGRVRVFRNGTFAIERVELSDGGTYQCKGEEYIMYYTFYVNGKLNFYTKTVAWKSEHLFATHRTVYLTKTSTFTVFLTKTTTRLTSLDETLTGRRTLQRLTGTLHLSRLQLLYPTSKSLLRLSRGSYNPTTFA